MSTISDGALGVWLGFAFSLVLALVTLYRGGPGWSAFRASADYERLMRWGGNKPGHGPLLRAWILFCGFLVLLLSLLLLISAIASL